MKMRLVPSEATEECMTNTLDIEVRLRALADLADKATPGPWESTDGDVWIDTREYVCCGRGSIHGCCGDPDVSGGQELLAQSNPTDADFIAHARTAPFREAADEIARLRARLDAAPHAGKVSRDSLHRVSEVLFNIYEDLPADAEYGKGLMKHLNSEHDGDCIKQPYTCGRCLAEKYEGYARAVLEAIGLEVEE